MIKEEITIVNRKDEIIGYKERGTLKPNDIYRVSALWINNDKGEILLSQRSFNKRNNPGRWGPAVAGTIDKGESYEENIIKETEEEIGLTDFEFTKSFYSFNDGQHKHFTQMYLATINKKIEDFTIQEEEVEQIKWFTPEELRQEISEHPDRFLKTMKKYIDYYLE